MQARVEQWGFFPRARVVVYVAGHGTMVGPFAILSPMQFLELLPLAQGAGADWHATSFAQAILYVVIFSLLGIGLAVLGYKLFDLCTPGDLHKEILENRNVAAALVGGAVIIGVCIIVAAAIVG